MSEGCSWHVAPAVGHCTATILMEIVTFLLQLVSSSDSRANDAKATMLCQPVHRLLQNCCYDTTLASGIITIKF